MKVGWTQIRGNSYRFIVEAGVKFKELREYLANEHGLYRQRILLKKYTMQFNHGVYDVDLIGAEECQFPSSEPY